MLQRYAKVGERYAKGPVGNGAFFFKPIKQKTIFLDGV
jgi:ABC-type oligopeptide transport system substrate-binding subunit